MIELEDIISETGRETPVFFRDIYVNATRSRQSQATRRSKINLYLAKVGKHPLDVTYQDNLDYCQWLEYESGYTFGVKEQRYSMIAEFWKTVTEFLHHSGMPEFMNPWPSKRFIPQFTERADKVKYEEMEGAEGYIPMTHCVLILKAARLAVKSYLWFAAFVLITVTGCRPGEILSIEFDDIDLNERFFYTGKHIGGAKSNQSLKRPLVFCFPEWVVPILRHWVRVRANPEMAKSKFLFPSTDRRNAQGYYYEQRMSHYARKICAYIKEAYNIPDFTFEPKDYRSTIITNRANAGCPASDNYYLQWHKISFAQLKSEGAFVRTSGTQEKFYKRSWISHRRDLYDHWNPYKLDDFAEV